MATNQLELQRDLYLQLLGAEQVKHENLREYLNEVLSLIVRLTEARVGYIELSDQKGNILWSTHSCSENKVVEIRKFISRSIISDAFKQNKTVFTPSAIEDKRYKQSDSVIAQRIEATICRPFTDGNCRGVIYLAGNFKSEFQAQAQEHLSKARLFSRSVLPLLPRLTSLLGPPKSLFTLRKVHNLDAMVGNSLAFEQLMKEAMTIAAMDVNVLITGETGTGKSALAECLHKNSNRRNGPLVRINCANLPEQLVENELFGSEAGAHSGAVKAVSGKVGSAEGGTLFLDEIGELPFGTQAKLLLFLEQGFYYPLGSNRPKKADVRFITATNQDLEAAIKNKSFREDLFYRICVFSLRIPPLRERPHDISDLANYLCNKSCLRFRVSKHFLSAEAIQYLMEQDYPGNVRQLDHIIQQGVLRASSENSFQVRPEHFQPHTPATSQPARPDSFKAAKAHWEKKYLELKLIENNWNVSETAKQLQLSRAQIHNLIKLYNLIRE